MKPRITIITENLPYDQIGREFAHELYFIDKEVFNRFNEDIREFPFGSKDERIIHNILKYDRIYNVNFVEYKTNEDE